MFIAVPESYRMSWEQKQRREYVLAAEFLEIRAKFDLMLTWFRKGTTLVIMRLTRAHTLFIYLNLIALR